MKCLLAAAVTAALCLSAAVHAGSLVDVTVIDRDTGATLPTYRQSGRLYVAGTPGHRYSVRLYNRTGARVLTVLSVDGVNAITGQTANPQQSGYVLGAYENLDVEGWRKDMTEIAQFNFTALDNSYAARTGRPANVGVIGVAVFREKAAPVWRERDDRISKREAPAQPSSNDSESTLATPPPAAPASAYADSAGTGRAKAAADAPASAAREVGSVAAQRPAPKPEESLGTGHGARESSYASYTTFERAGSSPDEVDSIWYDSYRNLVARGVIPTPRPIAVEPQPFPNRGFVPDPAG